MWSKANRAGSSAVRWDGLGVSSGWKDPPRISEGLVEQKLSSGKGTLKSSLELSETVTQKGVVGIPYPSSGKRTGTQLRRLEFMFSVEQPKEISGEKNCVCPDGEAGRD